MKWNVHIILTGALFRGCLRHAGSAAAGPEGRGDEADPLGINSGER